MMSIAIVIRVRNACSDLLRALEAIRAQDVCHGERIEVIVVDNESNDGSAVVARQFGAKVIFISTKEFSWGRALNRGIDAAGQADVAVLLSADATPADSTWLGAMIAPFADGKVAAVYGRQCPRADAPIDELVRLKRAFDDHPRNLTLDSIHQDLRHGRWVCSNACAAIRRSVWASYRFDELNASEEKPWLESILSNGLGAVYQPSAQVYHSHRESFLRFSFREWDIAQNFRRGRSRPVLLAAYVHNLVRRRISNCRSPFATWRQAAYGLWRLPLEIMAVSIIAALGFHGKSSLWARRMAW